MSVKDWLEHADRTAPWHEATVVVAGLGVAGFVAADALLERRARVIILDEADTPALQEKATLLRFLDAEVLLGPGSTAELPAGVDLVITTGWRPTAPLLAQAAERGIPIWGETELAWRFMHPDQVVPWLAITGTNGKTTTTMMLDSIMRAAGLTVACVGNIGRPVMEAVLDEVNYDVFVVELSSFQLHWSPSLRMHSAVVLNLHPDHQEWYAHLPDPMAAYAADKARIFHHVTHACVYNADEPLTEQMVEQADVTEGARAIGFTLGTPGLSMVGVVDDLLVDRAFVEQRQTSALELAKLDDVRPPVPHQVANALAAAALARSFGVPAQAVAQGLRDLAPGDHRIHEVGRVAQVAYVDDSKATNPHAADASLSAFDPVVWIAGGQAKGVSFDDLVARHASRMRAAVVLGVDRELIAQALSQHAPDVPVIRIDIADTGAMAAAVQAAAQVAQPGDTVLMAPGCASKDIWSGYDARGDAFIAAVAELTDPAEPSAP